MIADLDFASPERLLLLLLVVALAAAYLWLQRRRPSYAVRFSELELLASVAPRTPGWRRHVPALLLLLCLVALTTAFARPTGDRQVPRERATIVVALDTSASMLAMDVAPDRISAAKDAAASFVDRLPDRFNVGLVSFAGAAAVIVSPTQDHDTVTDAVEGLQLAGGTAIGEAVMASLQAIRAVPGGKDGRPAPARVVLLSDGANTAGRGLGEAAEAARAAGVPVSTIAYGTADGFVTVQGQTIPVPVDEPALRALAEATGGRAYSAESGEELSGVYADIGSQVGFTTKRRELTAEFAGVALLAALAAAGASLVWTSRFP